MGNLYGSCNMSVSIIQSNLFALGNGKEKFAHTLDHFQAHQQCLEVYSRADIKIIPYQPSIFAQSRQIGDIVKEFLVLAYLMYLLLLEYLLYLIPLAHLVQLLPLANLMQLLLIVAFVVSATTVAETSATDNASFVLVFSTTPMDKALPSGGVSLRTLCATGAAAYTEAHVSFVLSFTTTIMDKTTPVWSASQRTLGATGASASAAASEAAFDSFISAFYTTTMDKPPPAGR